jgi:glycosyltransferase involved in cell wall biosynthesis
MRVAVALPYASFVEVNMCKAFEKVGMNCWFITSSRQRFDQRGTGIRFEGFAKTLELPCLVDNSILMQYCPFPLMPNLVNTVRDLNVDIVSVSEHISPTTWLLSLLKDGWKTILTEHGHAWDSVRDRMYNFSARELLVPRIDGFTGIGLKAAHFLETLGARQVSIIPNPIDCELFNTSLRYEDRHNIVLYVGKVDSSRGLDFLLRAMKIVKKQIRDVKMWIIGAHGNLSPYVKTDSLFSYIGTKSHLEMPLYYNQAKVFVDPCPSYKRAGCGCALSEALACGTPVVGTEHLDFPFVWNDGKVGFVARKIAPSSLATAIINTLENGDRMQANCRKFAVKEFGYENVGEKYLELFKQVLSANE